MGWIFRSTTSEEEHEIAGFMGRLSQRAPDVRPRLADPRMLLLKSQLLARWDRERSVHAPLDVMDRLELVGALVAAGVLVAWTLPSVARLIGFVAA
jgi:hypothetical protein